jgi:hypothetical protein
VPWAYASTYAPTDTYDAPAGETVQAEETEVVQPAVVEAAPVPWAFASDPATCAAPVTYAAPATDAAPVAAAEPSSIIIEAPTAAPAVAAPTAVRAVNPVVARKGCC